MEFTIWHAIKLGLGFSLASLGIGIAVIVLSSIVYSAWQFFKGEEN